MKINLVLDNPSAIKEGYLNIDPLAPLGKTNLTRDTFQELREVDDAEAEEIIALDIIDYFSPIEIMTFLDIWVKKLKHGGIITLGFVDIYQLCKAVIAREINLQEANVELHGNQTKPWKTRRATMSIDFIAKALEARGLKIINKRLNAGKAIVKAGRP